MSQQRSALAGREAELERRVVEFLRGAGADVRTGVRAEGVVADVVTGDAIYELRPVLDRRALEAAVGRLKILQPRINPGARLAIVCEEGVTDELVTLARGAGVDVQRWDDEHMLGTA